MENKDQVTEIQGRYEAATPDQLFAETEFAKPVKQLDLRTPVGVRPLFIILQVNPS
jgi:hypothetical protein